MLEYSKDITSQNGEDGIIEFLINKLDINKPDSTCIEFGAWNGVHLSNTYNIITNFNWNGILI